MELHTKDHQHTLTCLKTYVQLQLRLSIHLSVHSALSLKFLVKQVYSLANALLLWNNTKWPYISLNILLLIFFSQYVCTSIRLSANRGIRVPWTHFLVIYFSLLKRIDERDIRYRVTKHNNLPWIHLKFWIDQRDIKYRPTKHNNLHFCQIFCSSEWTPELHLSTLHEHSWCSDILFPSREYTFNW